MRRFLILMAGLALAAAACGSDSDDEAAEGDAVRTVEVTMRDIDFDPALVPVKKGETVRFVFANEGEIVHDAFLGDTAAQEAHEREMRAADGGEHGHDEEGGDEIVVEPGERGELVYTFDEPGELIIGCHEPGHYEAGMRITVAVS